MDSVRLAITRNRNRPFSGGFTLIELLLVMVILFLVVPGKGADYHRDGINILRNLLLVQTPTLSIHPYAWALVYEMYFYLLFGLVVILCRARAAWLGLALVAFALVMRASGAPIGKDIVPLSPNSFTFGAGLLLGCCHDRLRFSVHWSLAALASLPFLAAPFAGSRWGIQIAALMLLVLLAVKSRPGSKQASDPAMSTAKISLVPGLARRVLEILGDMSYALYLTHAVVLTVLKTVLRSRGPGMAVAFFAACLGTGMAYYLAVERPLTRYLRERCALNVQALKQNCR